MGWQRLEHAPLFVLAIDDADMNPKRGRELLDLGAGAVASAVRVRAHGG